MSLLLWQVAGVGPGEQEGWQGEGRGGPAAKPVAPGCHRPLHTLLHPRRAGRIALRCLDDGNSYTLLFILKDTCSYLLLQSPQKIACYAKFLRGNRTRRSRPESRPPGPCQPAGWPGGCSLGDSAPRDAGGRVTHAILEPWVSPTVSLSVTGGCGLGSDARSEGRPCLLGCPLALPGHTRARVSGVTWVKPGVACRVFPRVLLAPRGARQRCSGRSGAGADPCEFGAAIAAAQVCHEQAGGSGKRGKNLFFPASCQS